MTIMNKAARIFLPNKKADRKDYIDGFKVTEAEFDIIRTLGENSDKPAVLNVAINGVRVGTLLDSQYAEMQRTASHDISLAFAQIGNLGRMVLIVMGWLFVLVPLLVFWGVVALAIFFPAEFQKSDLAAITLVVLALLQILLPASIVVQGALLAEAGPGGFGRLFGFRNHYEEAVDRMLRRHFNESTEGDVVLWQSAPAPANEGKTDAVK